MEQWEKRNPKRKENKMATLKQLQKQNVKLREAQRKLNEARKIQEERIRLIRENRQLAFRCKYPKAVATSQKIVRSTSKFGTKAWRGLQKYGERLAEAERREQQRNMMLKKQAKKVKSKSQVKKYKKRK